MTDLKRYQELQAQGEALRAEAAALRATIEPELQDIYAKRTAVLGELDAEAEIFFKAVGLEGLTDQATVGILYNMGWCDGRGSRGWSTTLREYLTAADLYISAHGGGWRQPDEEQAIYAWTVSLPKLKHLDEEKLERTKIFLEKLCKAHEVFKGDFVVSIFEHTLSQYGSYYLVFDREEEEEEEVWTVSTSTYGVVSADEGVTLDQALRQIAREHWYE